MARGVRVVVCGSWRMLCVGVLSFGHECIAFGATLWRGCRWPPVRCYTRAGVSVVRGWVGGHVPPPTVRAPAYRSTQ